MEPLKLLNGQLALVFKTQGRPHVGAEEEGMEGMRINVEKKPAKSLVWRTNMICKQHSTPLQTYVVKTCAQSLL
jgi:hypothetical protein